MQNWELERENPTAVQIREAAARETLAHALLFTGNGNLTAAAQYAAAAYECTAETDRPCGKCAACRKVREGIHPDVTIVQDAEHKNLSVDVIRSVRTDAYIRPNEGNRKVYLFPDCSLLTEQDQNVLLKIVEEGPPYAAFVFCAENSSLVLPTLRSRCVELKMHPAEQTAAEELSENAAALCRSLAAGKHCGPTEVLIRMERAKASREELQSLLEETRAVFAEALLKDYGYSESSVFAKNAALISKNLTKIQIMRTIELLQKYRQECLYNVSPGQVLGALAVELEGIL